MNLRDQQDEWDLFAKIRALRAECRACGLKPEGHIAVPLILLGFVVLTLIAAAMP